MAIYWEEGGSVCYVESPMSLEVSFDELLEALVEVSLHEVVIRQAPRTLFVVNTTVNYINNLHRFSISL